MPKNTASNDKAQLEYLKSIDTPTLANSLERLKLRPQNEGFAPLQLPCLFPELPRHCGYAVTAQVETMSRVDDIDIERFIQLYRCVEDSPKPVVIVFEEIGPKPEYAAHCGEGMATTFKRLGAVGLVTDCAVRDVPEVRAMGFQYFARGTVASHAYFRIVSVNVPIRPLGLNVTPGDILHGDENGLLNIPPQAIGKLNPLIAGVKSRESDLFAFIRGESFSINELKRRITH